MNQCECTQRLSLIHISLIVPYECVRGEDDASEYVYVWRDSQVKKVLVKPEKEMENGFLISPGSIQDGDILFLNPDLVERSGRVMPQLKQLSLIHICTFFQHCQKKIHAVLIITA